MIATDTVGATYVEYVLRGVPIGSLVASGIVSDGSTPLSFSLTLNASSFGADFTAAFDLTLGSASSTVQVAFHDDVTLQNGVGRENVSFTLRTGSQTARLTGPNTISASGSSLDLALTADQLAAAQAVFNATLDVTSGVGSLISPGEAAF